METTLRNNTGHGDRRHHGGDSDGSDHHSDDSSQDDDDGHHGEGAKASTATTTDPGVQLQHTTKRVMLKLAAKTRALRGMYIASVLGYRAQVSTNIGTRCSSAGEGI